MHVFHPRAFLLVKDYSASAQIIKSRRKTSSRAKTPQVQGISGGKKSSEERIITIINM